MLLKVDFHAGHGGASEKSKSMKEQASRAQRVELGAESGERRALGAWAGLACFIRHPREPNERVSGTTDCPAKPHQAIKKQTLDHPDAKSSRLTDID